ASGVLSEAVLRKVEAHRIAPHRSYAGLPSPGQFRIKNPKTWASLSIEVSEALVRGLKGPMRGSLLGPKPPSWWKFWKSTARDPASIIASSYCLRIDAQQEMNVETTYRFPRRGLYRCTGVVVSTRFPFGLFDKSRDIDQPMSLIVYPAPARTEDWLHTVHAHFGDVPRRVRGLGEEFFGLREAMPGEDSRRIHWKTSARRGALVVRENEAREQRAVEIAFLHCTGHDGWTPPHIEKAFEDGLERVVGLIQELAARDYRLGLRTARAVVEIGAGTVHMDRMLRILATVDLEQGVHQLATDDYSSNDDRVGRILIGLPGATSTQSLPAGLVLNMDLPGREGPS
ncbi:MAG: DUF58 domain-containing protein, partial [Bradymonadaceae bacterium]